MKEGYMDCILVVDLTTGRIEKRSIPPRLKEDYVGGKGFGARILYDLLPPQTWALAPENPLMFFTGPLTGTAAPSMRACVVTKSPLTGTFLDSYFGGSFGPEIKYAGYDGIIITGQAPEPVYLWIEDQKVELRPAKHLSGRDTFSTVQLIKEETRSGARVACIGPAGENQVLLALITCEYNRQAGRGGAGAVMGSKNLKAVAVYGTRGVAVRDRERFLAAVEQATQEVRTSPDTKALTESGTAASVPFASEVGLLPRLNYRYGTFTGAVELSDHGQRKHLWLKNAACTGCPIACSKVGVIRSGRYAGTVSDIVEYESAAMLGANLDIADIKAVTYLTHLCDALGLDTISAGGVAGFAMEAVERGLAEPRLNGVELKFGSPEAAEQIIRAVAHKEGFWGQLLAQGVKRAADQLGPGAEEFAVHVKGLETPAWGPRGCAGMGLAYMTADRGGCHQRGFTVTYEIGGVPWEGKQLDPLSPYGKAGMVISLQNYLAALDTFVKCDFGGFGIIPETYLNLFNSCTGRDYSLDDLYRLGERIWNTTRLFNLREGITGSQDTLPPRFVREPLPDGPGKGHRISDQDMAVMLEEYYRERGWDQDGKPLAAKLEQLKIEPHQKLFTI
jgi:aldehyde:ferredoxin oxidoreductase